MAESNGGGMKQWTEWFRIVTPIMLFFISLLAGSISAKLSDIDNKLFKHLTNDELHCPRSLMVTRIEFDTYQKMRDREMGTIGTDIRDLKCMMESHSQREK